MIEPPVRASTMAQTKLAALLPRLEEARALIGTIKEGEIARLIKAAARATSGNDATSLIRFHDLLVFFRAFSPGPGVLRLADKLLDTFEPRVKAVLAAGADADDFAPEEVAGIAGTVVEATFSYPMVCWLVKHHPREIAIQWKDYERDPQRGLIWPRFFPLMEEDSLIEANVPYLKWLKAARGRQDELPWLVQQFQRLPISDKEKGPIYDSLEIMVRWDLSGSSVSRTMSRKRVKQFYFHQAPLIQRRQVSFADELAKPPLPITTLSPGQGEKALDLMKQTLGIRYRELYGTSNADSAWVVRSNVARGAEIYLCGLPPDKRLPLRAYLAGLTVKNGVAINYFECSSLFDWTEIGFNTFPAYRDGETAWIYAQTLRLIHQLHGTNAISVYPYQIGDENEEAIASGAFWFYRKMGFRSMNPALEKLAQAEEKNVLAKSSYRTPARVLRRLSKANVVYELPQAQREAWDNFSVRNIGLAVQRRAAGDFNGDVHAMRKAAVEGLVRVIKVNTQKLKLGAQIAFADFAMVLSLVPNLAGWSSDDKAGLREIVASKAGRTELRYLRLLQKHSRLRAALIRLGSQEMQ
jgi:hypothetical protein